jgi:hypothetical protein
MTFRELQKHLGRLTANQLDSTILVMVDDGFFEVEGLNIASGVGEFLYKDDVFFSVADSPIDPKEDEESVDSTTQSI